MVITYNQSCLIPYNNSDSSDSFKVLTRRGASEPVEFKGQPHHDAMTRYDVICPAAPWENETTDQDRAWDLCFSLSEEYGYAEVRQNGMIIGEYRNGQ